MSTVILRLLVLAGACLWQASAAQPGGNLRFAAVDVYLETAEPVAAWQFELSGRRGLMKVVGVENGESAAYRETPYYDREAVQLGAADRIIVADYSLAEAELLPKKSRSPSRFSPAWLIFSISPMRTVTKNDSLSAITTSPAEAPRARAIARISRPNSWLNSIRSMRFTRGPKRPKRLERFQLF